MYDSFVVVKMKLFSFILCTEMTLEIGISIVSLFNVISSVVLFILAVPGMYFDKKPLLTDIGLV